MHYHRLYKVKTLIFVILIGKSPIQNKKCSHPAFDIDPRELEHGGKFVFKRCLLAAVVKVLNSLTIDKFFDSFSHLQDVFYEQKGGSRHPFVQFLCWPKYKYLTTAAAEAKLVLKKANS